MVAILDESFNKLEYAREVEFFLFFFFALEGSFCSVDIFPSHHSSFLALVPVPPANVLDGLDCGELAVVDIDIMGDTHKWLVDVGDGEHLDARCLQTCLIYLANLLVQTGDFGVEQYHCHDLQRDQC